MKKIILLFILINITKNSVSQKNNPYNKTNDQLNNMSKSYLRMIGEDDNIDAQHPINASDPDHIAYLADVFSYKDGTLNINNSPTSNLDETLDQLIADGKLHPDKREEVKESILKYWKDGPYPGNFGDDVVAYAKDWLQKGNDAKEYQNKIIYFDKAIKLNPYYADAYNMRGFAKYFLNDKNGACLDWNKAGELGYSDAYTNIKNFCQ